MSEPFLGEIRIVGFSFAPRGWALCDGQLLPIAQNQSLFSILGTNFGGDGRSEFALPDLRGRSPMHESGSPGERGGEESHTLTLAEIPSHTHSGDVSLAASTATATDKSPEDKVPASGDFDSFDDIGNDVQHNPLATGNTTSAGGGQAHDNMQPFLTLNFVIALRGLFPPRN